MFRKRTPGRYVARSLDMTLLGVKTGVVDDTRPNESSVVDRDGAGFKYVTTYSNAKRIARKANRLDRI